MSIATKFPTANEVETGGWTNPSNAHADDGVYATAAPGKNAGISTRYKTFGFDADIPSGATIDAVKILYEYKVSTTSSVATMRVRARINDVDEENHDDTTEPTADTTITVDITADRAWTRADLLDAALKITADGRRGNSNNAVTFSLDFLKVEVTYTASQTFTKDVADTAGLTEAELLQAGKALAESAGLTETDVIEVQRILAESLNPAETLVLLTDRASAEALGLSESLGTSLVKLKEMAESAGFTEALLLGFFLGFQETVGLTEAVTPEEVQTPQNYSGYLICMMRRRR